MPTGITGQPALSKEFYAFLSLSSDLTGFSQADLLGTGCALEFFQQVESAAGEAIAGKLWTAAGEIAGASSGEERETRIRHEILADPALGPVARGLLKMWYLGHWEQLAADWRKDYGVNAGDFNHLISAAAYQECLAWRAIGSHSPGANAPGFGSWALPPGN